METFSATSIYSKEFTSIVSLLYERSVREEKDQEENGIVYIQDSLSIKGFVMGRGLNSLVRDSRRNTEVYGVDLLPP